jgi:stage II sporulation protein AA (anti-sigma F factor antagonist)
MEIKGEKHGGDTVAYIFGEVDHHNAKEAREKLDTIIDEEQPVRFFLDLSGVTFCDSSGLGLVMGRMRKCLSVGSVLVIKNPSDAAERILRIAGMDKIIKIERG